MHALFFGGEFMPHGYCYLWNSELVWLHVVSDAIIALAYIAIALGLLYLSRKRRDLPFNWMLVCFAIFIVACGCTHLMEIYTLWVPAYWVSGAVKATAAAASFPAAVVLMRLIPRVVQLPGQGELQQAHEALRRALAETELRVQERTAELADANEALRREIDERRSTEQALSSAEEKYRGICENSIEGMFQSTVEGQFLFVNPAMARMFGYSSAEKMIASIPHIGAQLYVQPEQRAGLARTLAERESVTGMEIEMRRKDGRTIWVSACAWTVRRTDGDVAFHEGTMIDITERKRAEQERDRLILAVEQANEAIIITGTDARIVYVNPAFERITGYARSEAIGQNPRMLKCGDQDEAFYRNLWDTIAAKRVWTGTFNNRRKDGSIYAQEGTITAVHDSAGRVVNYLAVQRDVTREKQLEEHLRQAQKMEAVGTLAGGVAHDFNNILMVISGYADLLIEQTAGGSFHHRAASNIKEASDRATALTRQLLAFSRQQALAPRVLNLNRVIGNIENMLRRLIREDIELFTVFDKSLGEVQADPGQMEQVLMNLAVNARDAMPLGGKLLIETANIAVDDIYAASRPPMTAGSYVMVTVTDTGSGMDAATRARIFEPFFTTKELGRGTGLGLSTVYGIVKQSGGFIWVYSEPDRGTTFKIYLPRVQMAVDQQKNQQAAALRVGSETVLLVEDEAHLRELIGELLRGKGYTVLEASNGTEALRVARQHGRLIHLLMTDAIMPETGGIELAERLSAVRPEMKVLLISGYAGETLAGGLKPGVAFLQKPFTDQALAQKLRELLG